MSPASSPTRRARRRIADLLGESFDPAETAVAAFEREDGTPKPPWLVEAYFDRAELAGRDRL